MKLPNQNPPQSGPINILLKEFYKRVILTEETTVAFLGEHNLLSVTITWWLYLYLHMVVKSAVTVLYGKKIIVHEIF